MKRILDRLLPWRKWKYRALAAELALVGLEKTFQRATGMSSVLYWLAEHHKLAGIRPGAFIITNIEVPHA